MDIDKTHMMDMSLQALYQMDTAIDKKDEIFNQHLQ